jgi:hypothetical protein
LFRLRHHANKCSAGGVDWLYLKRWGAYLKQLPTDNHLYFLHLFRIYGIIIPVRLYRKLMKRVDAKRVQLMPHEPLMNWSVTVLGTMKLTVANYGAPGERELSGG